MNEVPRPGFDGSYIHDRRRELAWLIIGGCRYHVDGEAGANIFHDAHKPSEAVELVDDIPLRGAIRTGSRLVRGDPNGPIFLFAVDIPENRLHLISSWETFTEFGFAIEKVVVVPPALLTYVPRSEDIVSALDRVTRRAHAMYLPVLEALA